MESKNVLVTGGAGFIGSSLCEELVKRGHNVVCFDSLSTGKESNLEPFRDKLTMVRGDSNTKDLDDVFKERSFDWVFHYAAVVGVERTLERPLEVLKDIEGIKRLLELSRKTNVKKVIFASSSEVYGEPAEIPENEDGHLNAKIPYAVTKLMGEKYMEAYLQTYGLKTTSLRFFNVYGPRQDSTPYGFVVGIFIRQVLEGKQPTIFGDGSQTRDFVFIEDNVKAAIAAAETAKSEGEAINIGTGKPTTILDLAETIIRLSGKTGLSPKFLPPREHEIMHRFPSVKKMHGLLDHKAEHSLESGLKRTIEWYKNRM